LFFTTAHYDGHPMLLVRLGPLGQTRARVLIEESYRLRVGTTATRSAKPTQLSRNKRDVRSTVRTLSPKPGRKTSRKA
jgi:hypothetical protein